jgi:hypothetical protein
MPHQFFHARRPHDGLDYDTYMRLMESQANAPTDGLDEEAAERIGYTKLNLHRSQRIGRTYPVSDELGVLLDRIDTPQLWMVLTEPWCGDSAQCLPHLAVMARRNSMIDLRILPRDENLDVMDLYLTGESRSVPRLVVFDAEGNELWTWGPRPAAAQVVFDQAKAEGLEKPDLLERLHLWYGRDRGREVDAEIATALAGA